MVTPYRCMITSAYRSVSKACRALLVVATEFTVGNDILLCVSVCDYGVISVKTKNNNYFATNIIDATVHAVPIGKATF